MHIVGTSRDGRAIGGDMSASSSNGGSGGMSGALMTSIATLLAAVIGGIFALYAESDDDSVSPPPSSQITPGSPGTQGPSEPDRSETSGGQSGGGTGSTLAYGKPETRKWALHFSHNECGNGGRDPLDTINWDDVVADADPGEDDLGYGQISICSRYTALVADPHAKADMVKGGLVEEGEATDPLECRSAAVAGALPTDISPARLKQTGIVKGAALCLITDRERIVRARIDSVIINPDTPGGGEFVTELRGEATIWTRK